MRKIVVAFDHAGVELRDVVLKTIKECGCEIVDVGTDSNKSVDFPDYAFAGAQKILNREADKGIFVCGSGVGMCLAANKIKGIYASVCHDVYSAHQAVEHDDINVLCLGSRVIGSEAARELITAYLAASFNQKPNQVRRMNKVFSIEDGSFVLKNNSMRLYELGQSVWLDNIRRGLIKNDSLAKEIEQGLIRGITSNPTIFKKAIAESNDYDNALTPMALAQADAGDIFSQLVVEDIRDAADLFRDLYIRSGGDDGYVSVEVSPLYAYDCEKTVSEAKALWKSVNRPNIMIKIPGTRESLPAITELTAAGINLNITLLFAPDRYRETAEAFIAGLKKRIENGDPVEKIRSVASVFVSRIDTKVDALLAEKGFSAREMLGQTAIRNAQHIYNIGQEIFESDTFFDLKSRGAVPQRVLFASTSTKNPQYNPLHYVETLIGENTINTMPPATLEALQKSSNPSRSLPADEGEIRHFFTDLEAAGIDMVAVYAQLEKEGIEAFQKDYLTTLEAIRGKCRTIQQKAGDLREKIYDNFKSFESADIMRRIFSKDPTVWTFDTQAFAEIRNRLGWLDAFKNTVNSIEEFTALRNELKSEGINKILLLGMGGSSLAPEVMANVFDGETDIKLQILDSTDPIQVSDARRAHDPETTFFIVSSKSGGTAEVKAFLDYFYDQAVLALGEKAGRHFAAITDPGTALERRAKELGFRNIFLSDPSVGGRFSVLTPFGILPAILIGLDKQQIALKVNDIMKFCSPSLTAHRNEGAALGGFIGTAALEGKDKLTILTDPELKSFGSWLEQLIAESSGKEGKGIIPVDTEPVLENIHYASDRCFVYINLNGSRESEIDSILTQGHPVYEIHLDGLYDLFSEFYRWEIAVAVACSILGVNAFDQPNVQDSKTRTVAKVNDYHQNGNLEELPVCWEDDNVRIWAPESLGDLKECCCYSDVISCFISNAQPGKNYIAINAYLPRNDATTEWLQKLRANILHSTNCATTLGFGPRFQHSTGQLHKGGTNNGYFIQIVADYEKDIDIPNESLTYKVLERAQALGDLESLTANERNVIRINFKKGIPGQA